MILEELERDTIRELINIGMGTAAVALGEMVGDPVLMSVPYLDIVPRTGLAEVVNLRTDTVVMTVRQPFSGTCSGQAVLVFPEGRSLQLVRTLLDDDIPLDSLTELEQEALLEVGNIVLNACLGTFTNLLSLRLRIDLPVLREGPLAHILLDDDGQVSDAFLLILRINFETPGRLVDGHLVLVLESASIETLRDCIRHYLESLR